MEMRKGDENEEGIGGDAGNQNVNENIPILLSMVVRWLIDDD